jgi:DedD protein
MEDKFSNHLDDILLDKEKSKFDKIKKIVLLVASLALIFTISIIVMKVLNSQDSEQNISSMLPSEPIAEQDIKEPEPLFEQLPLDEQDNVDNEFDQIVKGIELKAKEEMMSEAEDIIEKEIEKPSNSAKALASVDESSQVQTPPKEERVGFEKLPENLMQEEPAPKKDEPKETIQVEKVESADESEVATVDIPSGWYIQVGAFSKVRDSYLKSISDSGFNYQLKKRFKDDGSSFTKIMIGPYDSKDEANSDLGKVKEKIAKGAYITKV